MDKVLQPKKRSLKKILILIGSILFLIIMVYLAISSRESSYKIDRSKLSYALVEFGKFQDMVTFQGVVEPLKTMQLDATEGGTVEEIFVEDGQMVKRGQALLRLSNTTLHLDFMNRETQIVEQINNLRSTRISLDQNKRQIQEQLVDLTYNIKEQRRKYKVDSSLFADSVISKLDYLASESNFHYLLEKQKLMKERFKTDEIYRKSQLDRIDASVEMMERNLNAIRKNLESLTVRASIDGQLNSFDHEIGQTKSRGENLGRIDVIEGYQISAFVDQYYLNRLKVGQSAKANFGSKPYKMMVKKIFPTIVNSQFEVHLDFIDSILPNNIRRGQNVQVRLELSATKKALLVPRGGFSQSNQGSYVFVVDGNTAIKRNIKFGSQNPDFIEIIEGLEQGETIIKSNYNAFGEAEKIILTEN